MLECVCLCLCVCVHACMSGFPATLCVFLMLIVTAYRDTADDPDSKQ